ncbi:MAG: formylglycine-generating enzyme family protein [Caldisericales bacterium]|nr:formylglycine-generating enzyme family protein [Caldisericales bacterium]
MDGSRYPWGDTIDETRANYDSNIGDTTTVGSYPAGASPYGALDMAGNVWEWVLDWYAEDYYSQSTDRNPIGPQSGDKKVRRGGSWFFNGGSSRSANRVRSSPADWNYNIGFRCAFSE